MYLTEPVNIAESKLCSHPSLDEMKGSLILLVVFISLNNESLFYIAADGINTE